MTTPFGLDLIMFLLVIVIILTTSTNNLSIDIPTSSDVVWTTSENVPIAWTPFEGSGGEALVSLVNSNTGPIFDVRVNDTGSTLLAIQHLSLSPGTYHVEVSNIFGITQSAPFLIKTNEHLTISSPTLNTNVSNTGKLVVKWSPVNELGGNITIYLQSLSDPSISCGPISLPDTGFAILDLARLAAMTGHSINRGNAFRSHKEKVSKKKYCLVSPYIMTGLPQMMAITNKCHTVSR